MNIPRLSVILPTYNSQAFIAQAVKSVLDQSFQDFEFIIIDDGSTDATGDIVKSFNDPRIRLERRGHAGLVNSLNYGISVARGEYIARMDSDDQSLPDRFFKQVAFLDLHPQAALCGSWAVAIDEHGKNIGTYSYTPAKIGSIRRYALLHNPFIHPSVMIRKGILQAAGGYRRFWKHTEDYELWTRIIYHHEAGNIPEILIKYRIHAGQITVSRRAEMRFYGIIVRLMAVWRFLLSLFVSRV